MMKTVSPVSPRGPGLCEGYSGTQVVGDPPRCILEHRSGVGGLTLQAIPLPLPL